MYESIVFLLLLLTSSTLSNPPCGTFKNETIGDLKITPKTQFFLNAPFDIEIEDFLYVESLSEKPLFIWMVPPVFDLPKLFFDSKGYLRKKGRRTHVDVKVMPFVLEHVKNPSNLSLTIEWGNIPTDFNIENLKNGMRVEDCPNWRQSVRKHTVKIAFNT